MTDSITNKHGTVIRVGQVWADNDPRCQGRRTLRVVALQSTRIPYAVCEILTGWNGNPPERKRRTRLQVDRMHPTSTGYRLVSEGGEAL
ncbi:hypothetical protein [Nocardia sp. NPDC019255]|uniref:hypothetical protein n=1 Tax=Nocardia sp. NPDC019255 TaxID=3154591 RepID=UPI00340893EF